MAPSEFQVSGQLIDIERRTIEAKTISVRDGKIAAIEPVDAAPDSYLLPGFIDAHVHIESSMLVPSEFARAAVVHGTVATVSDPHEIANVLGLAGVYYMLDNAAHVPLKIYFGAPSCVPATIFETAGAELTVEEVAELLADDRILYLSEMMNFPGVIAGDPHVLAKMAAATERGKPIDGHAPGLRGDQARLYMNAGPSTDHECFTKEEALDKLAAGAKIAIREGSAARNFDALHTLIDEYPHAVMLCSDDKHPDELVVGHVNQLVARAVQNGRDLYNTLRAACLNPIEHYKLPVGQLRIGDPADFIEVDSLEDFATRRTWIAGQLVAKDGKSLIPAAPVQPINLFVPQAVTPEEIALSASGDQVRIIEAIDGQLVTNEAVEPTSLWGPASGENGRQITPLVEHDILKLVVACRYEHAKPAVALVRNFGLERGALASSVAHDSHNVIAVGASDAEICRAIQLVMECRGGLAAVGGGQDLVLPLPVAGLMATDSAEQVAQRYSELDKLAKELGSSLRAPFMTLSFMALLVIPELKLSDLGLFNGNDFSFVDVDVC